jgi:ATP/maltotriose-dependent transcriptional regulator MalT
LLRLELRRRLPGQLPVLHRLAAGWFSDHGEIVDAIRHTQAAGDWPDAARLLAERSFGLTLDGQAQTIQTLLRAFRQVPLPRVRICLSRAQPAILPRTPGRGCRLPGSGRSLDHIDAARP